MSRFRDTRQRTKTQSPYEALIVRQREREREGEGEREREREILKNVENQLTEGI